MYKTTGVLIYSDNPYKLIVQVDDEIGNYYRSLIPKYFNVKKGAYSSHISVIRNETPINLKYWAKYHGQEIPYEYDSYIYNGTVYYWLNAYSKDLEDIRIELGLENTSIYTRSPDEKCRFHITLGNIKHLL
jgi:hypothetical protein